MMVAEIYPVLSMNSAARICARVRLRPGLAGLPPGPISTLAIRAIEFCDRCGQTGGVRGELLTTPVLSPPEQRVRDPDSLTRTVLRSHLGWGTQPPGAN